MTQETLISSIVAQWGTVVDSRAIGGGCMSDAMRVTVRDSNGTKRDLFVKCNQAGFAENFRCEFDGLRQLAAVGVIRTPEPMCVDTIGDTTFLVMEWIEAGRQSDFGLLGQQLADLHRRSSGRQIGLQYDNFLGATRQINTSSSDWIAFVQEQRIGAQLRLAIDAGLIDAACKRDIESIIHAMPSVLAGREEMTSLLHGDLWSGNYLFDSSNQPVVIDPAIYYGCREAEFGMLLLFGGCPPEFYESYNNAWPLPPGWQQRCKVYVLYHLLNHLNLFGGSYLNQCKRVSREIVVDSGV